MHTAKKPSFPRLTDEEFAARFGKQRASLWPWNLSNEEFAARYAHLQIDLKPLFEPCNQPSTEREATEVAQQNA